MVGLWRCTPTPNIPMEYSPSLSDSVSLVSWKALGDSLTLERQRLILQKLLQVAQREGWGGAVRYCHTAAETLTTYHTRIAKGDWLRFVAKTDTILIDSTGSLSLQRVALRYRNPKNALRDSLDEAAFAYFDSTRSSESIVWPVSGRGVRYYRPIYLAMEPCLKCHGKKENLDGQALAEIRKRYPGDKATDFQLGDLRGLWRMEARFPSLME